MTESLDSRGHEKQTPGYSYGLIVLFSGSTIPDGWKLCDGANGTPDLRDRFVVGDTAVGVGSSGGTVSATVALTHSGAAIGAHSAHVVTQPSAHSAHAVGQAAGHPNHVVTQAAAHSAHASQGAHTHDSHVANSSTNNNRLHINGPGTHSSDGGHAHDAHSAHAGAALDAHSAHSGGGDLNGHSTHAGAAVDAHSSHGVTQNSGHDVVKHYLLAYVMWTGVTP